MNFTVCATLKIEGPPLCLCLCCRVEEEFPRYTTKELRDHFERTIEEAAQHKPIKVGTEMTITPGGIIQQPTTCTYFQQYSK